MRLFVVLRYQSICCASALGPSHEIMYSHHLHVVLSFAHGLVSAVIRIAPIVDNGPA